MANRPLNRNSYVLVTGGAGFLGSAIVRSLNEIGVYDIDVVDCLGCDERWMNLRPLRFRAFGTVEQLERKMSSGKKFEYDFVFHFGGISDRSERDFARLMGDYSFTMSLLNKCIESDVRTVYASDAETYGDYSMPFSDDERFLHTLRPLNPHAYSRHLIDAGVFHEIGKMLEANLVVSLKYSSVFGPNEYHKGERLVCDFISEVRSGRRPLVPYRIGLDGVKTEIERDFLYVKDAARIALWFASEEGLGTSGVFNAGSGNTMGMAETVRRIADALGKDAAGVGYGEEWPDRPASVMLDVQKLMSAGYSGGFRTFEDAVREYARYLSGSHRLGEEDAWMLAEI